MARTESINHFREVTKMKREDESIMQDRSDAFAVYCNYGHYAGMLESWV